ncbi:MAG: beta-agarase, partial [Thermoguttaceae bacterium]|nr:beta-agarase [Thermoguttaceae bacterium]
QVAPNHLYLGCRFAWVNDRAVRASAKYCDVIGFNKYSYSIADFTLPEGIDKPAIVGEFHFGALDRGMFHTGLRPVADQNARAAAYKSYVLGALDNPHWVGTHWFQWGDQATTGRGDGENYQIGFMDVCDTPYPETIQASREVGAALYRTRYEGGKP